MDVVLPTGQRPGDVFGVARADIKDGSLFFAQRKTGKNELPPKFRLPGVEVKLN